MIRTIVVCLLLVIAVLAVYWQTTGFGFIEFDDGEYVRDNLLLQHGLSIETVRWAFTEAYHSNWHPVTWVSWLIDVEIAGGINARAMHITNVLIHMVNVLLLFGVLRAMTGLRGFWPSALVAGLFAVHPMHVESVAWISERKDVLCGLFWMLSLWAYLYYTRRPSVMRYLLLLLCFAMGLMSKGMMVTLPGVLLLLDWWPLRRGLWIVSGERPVNSVNPPSAIHRPKSLWILVLEKFPLLILGIGLSVATWMIQRPTDKLEEGVWIPMSQRLSNGALAYVRYVGKVFRPDDLAVLYPNPNLIGDAWPAWRLWVAVAVIVAITVLVMVLRRQRPWLIVGWLWFLGTMLPVLGLVQFGRQSMADRYAYLPFIGLYIAIAWELARVVRTWPPAKFIIAPATGLAVAALAIAAHRQASLWSDSRMLFQHAIDVTGRNWVMHRNLAGMLEADGRTDEAFAHMEQALAIFPDCAWLHDHYGAMLAKHDRLTDAQRRLQRAIELDPQSAQAHLNLGIVFSIRRQYDDAMLHLERARHLDPTLADRCDGLVTDIQRRRGAARP